MLGHACNDDGALHAEKFYRTATEEFAARAPRFAGGSFSPWRASPPAPTAIPLPEPPTLGGCSEHSSR